MYVIHDIHLFAGVSGPLIESFIYSNIMQENNKMIHHNYPIVWNLIRNQFYYEEGFLEKGSRRKFPIKRPIIIAFAQPQIARPLCSPKSIRRCSTQNGISFALTALTYEINQRTCGGSVMNLMVGRRVGEAVIGPHLYRQMGKYIS